MYKTVEQMNEGDFEELKDIKIVQIDNPSHFYGLTYDDEDEYEILEKAINDYYANEQLTALSLYSPKKNEDCIAKSKKDFKWHRVRAQEIFSTSKGPQANCFFVDHGHTELVSIQWLRKAAKKFLELPFRVKTFSLYGIKALTLAILPDMTTAETPVKVWDTSAEEYMRKFLKENTEMKYNLRNLDSQGKHYIILHVKTKNGEETMNDILVNLKFATRDLPVDNLAEAVDHKMKKSESSLNRSQIKTIQIYLSDTVTNKRSERLQKCVDQQNRAEMTQNTTSFNNPCNKISDVKGHLLSGHQSDVDRLRKALSALSKSASDIESRDTRHKSVSDTELTPSKFHQMHQKASSAEGSMTSQTLSTVIPRLVLRIPGSVSPEIIRSPYTTSVLQLATGPSPRLSVGSRMAKLQNIVCVKPKCVSDTETTVGSRNALTDDRRTHTELTNSKPHLSDGDNITGLSHILQNNRNSVQQDTRHVTQNKPPIASNDGNVSDSSTVTSGSRNLFNLRGLIPNANPNLSQLTGGKRLSDSSDTDNVNPLMNTPRTKFTTPQTDIVNSSSESSLKPILKRTPSSGEKQSVRFSDCESGTDKEDRKMTMFGQMKGKKLLDTLNIGCSRSKEQDTSDSVKLRQNREGILIHSCESVEAFYEIEEVPFHHLTKEVIRHLGFPAPTPIQSYVWRALFHGNNVVGIAAPNSGKTFCYLSAVVSHLMNLGSYAELPTGNGPIAVFLVPTWKKAQLLYDHVKVFIRTLSKPRALVIYGGNQEDSFAIPLINGCELLIATPPCLERMIEKKATHVDRLCHLVIDDADVLLEEFHTEVEKLMKRYAAVLKEQGQRSAPQQILMFSNQWCEAVYQFTWAYMSDPVIVFASMFEAAVYGKVKQVVTMCRSDQRSAQFVAMLDTVVTEGSRIVIFADTAMGAIRVNELLNRNAMYAIIAHSEMDKYDIDNARDEWYQPLTDYKILVASDSCLSDLQITNATVVIHYDMAESKSVFGIRLSCMRDNFWSFDQQDEDDKVTPTSYIIMTETCAVQARAICKLLKRTGCPAAPQLSAMLAGMSQEKENDKIKDLCHFLKAYGECRKQSTCKNRHTVLTDIAKSNKHPTSGEVKVIVTHVEDASHFYARILEHRPTGGGSTNNLALAYIDIPPQMMLYFNKLENRIRQTQLCPGELCALEDNEVFYRVKICDIFDTNTLGSKMQAQVFFVDEGRRKNVVTHKLYVLPEKLKAYPQQAVSVYVCRVKPIDRDDEWTSNASMYIHDLLTHKELEGRIVLSLENTLWLDPLVERMHLHAAQTVINKMHVRSELLKNNFAIDNPEHIEKLYALCKGKVEIPDINTKTPEEPCIDTEVLPEAKSYHDVYLHEMELPDLIFLQKKETNKLLEEMMCKLADRCKSEIKTFRNLQVGSVCLAQCSRDDSWNRAVVLEIIDDDNVEIFYADYGDKDTVTRDKIQIISKEFMDLPFQAVECQLAHVKPRGEEWKDDSGDTLWDLSHGINGDKKLLVAKVVSKSQSKYAGFHKYNVELFDTSTPDDINLSQEMVWSGVASPQENSSLKELFPKPPIMGQVYISPVRKIADLCSTIYWTKDEKKKLNASKEIFQIVSKAIQKSPLDLIGYNGIAPVIKLIGRINNPEIHNNMLECLVCAAAAEDRLSEEILNQDGVLSISKCLEQTSRPQIQLHAVRSITKWIKSNKRFLKAFEEDTFVNGLLHELLQSYEMDTGSSSNEVFVAACNTLNVLCKGSRKSVDFILRNKICITIQKCLHNTKSHEVTEALFMFLVTLVDANGSDSSLKKEKLTRAIVSKIDTNLHCENCVMCGLRFCNNLCEAGRKYKTMLLELGTVVILNTVLLQNLSKRTTELCQKIYNAIAIKVHPETIANRPTTVHNYSKEEQGLLPQVHWSQNSFVILITVKVKGVDKKSDPIQVSATTLTFRAQSDNKLYSFQYELYDKVIPGKCHTRVRSSEVIISLCKDEKGKWPRLLKNKIKPANLSVDFEKFVDSSSDSEVYDEEDPFKLKKKEESSLYFKGIDNILSNFYPCELSYQGRRFISAEHLYQYFKAIEHNKTKIAEAIICASDAKMAKNISKSILCSADWHQKKLDIMRQVLTLKCIQCQPFYEVLMSLKSWNLVHNVTDNYWGEGLYGEGENKMGHLLMELRDKFG